MCKSFDDANIVRGEGDNEDYPNGLPIGSFYKGKPICGAPTAMDPTKPCSKPPNDTGRCFSHSPKESRKTPDKSFYKDAFTPEEVKHSKDIKVGNLKDEIVLFKVLLRRKVSEGAPGRELAAIGHAIRELEELHFHLMGGEVKGNPYDVVISLRKCVEDMDNSVIPEVPNV